MFWHLMRQNIQSHIASHMVRLVECEARCDTFSAKQVAEIFIEKVVRKCGVPKSLISGQDKILWKELFLALGTILKRSTVFDPKMDG